MLKQLKVKKYKRINFLNKNFYKELIKFNKELIKFNNNKFNNDKFNNEIKDSINQLIKSIKINNEILLPQFPRNFIEFIKTITLEHFYSMINNIFYLISFLISIFSVIIFIVYLMSKVF